jgi:predicted nucleic acid-binding protein
VSESWVINASPVILLAKVGLMERIPSWVETLVIPQPVVDEILRVDTDAASLWLRGDGRQFVRPAMKELAELTAEEIGFGERAVISWAVAQPAFKAVWDDREAREIAHRLGIRILGTVGVDLRLKQSGVISKVKSHLIQIRQLGGYISDDLLREALRNAGEG